MRATSSSSTFAIPQLRNGQELEIIDAVVKLLKHLVGNELVLESFPLFSGAKGTAYGLAWLEVRLLRQNLP